MEKKNGHKWIVVAVIVAAGCICAAAARCCRAMCRISYLNLGSAASLPKQIATA